MSHLVEDHPEVFENMQSGGFVVQIGEHNPFGKIPVDQTCEETVTRDTQTAGGTKGFSLKPKAVSKYYLVAEYRSIFFRNLKDMLHMDGAPGCQVNDLQKSRIAKDESDVKSLLETINNWINPFELGEQDLVCLSSGKAATEKIEPDLQAHRTGENAYRRFSEMRLESSPAKVKFNDSMKKAQLKTFSNLGKEMKVRRGTANEAILRAVRALFAKMIAIAETRELSMGTAMSHPLGLLPWSLATDDGSLRKNKKPSLAKDLQKDVPAAELIPPSSAWIIDGMALVERLNGDGNTFAEIADALMAMVLREGASSKQIDVVFNVYRETSIKNTERERRGCQAGNEYRNLQPNHRVCNDI